MESTFLPSPAIGGLPSSTAPCRRKKHVSKVVAARGRDFGGELVDQDLIVLRMRIREMKKLEASESAPSHWMEWEKRYYCQQYSEDVCEAVGLLQSFLMNTRPGLAVGFLALITVSVPTAGLVFTFQAAEIVKSILSGVHLG